MTPATLLTDELEKFVGFETDRVLIEVDKTLITRFADGVGDPNPLWRDAEAARNGLHGGIVAPPSLFCAAFMRGISPVESFRSALPAQVLDGGGEWEVLRPVRLGDTITVVNRVADISERQGRVGPMLLVTTESTWRNQRLEVVATSSATAIFY